jgi:MFS family permease
MSEVAEEPVCAARDTRRAMSAAVACAIGTAFGYVPIVVQTFPLFLKPLAAEFGWTRSNVSALLIAGGMAAAVASPLAGRLVDRKGARAIVLPASILSAISVMLLSVPRGAPQVLYGMFVLLGFVQTACGPIPYNKVIAAWFSRRRGLALGLAIGGAMSFGNGLAPQLARVLIERLGWRQAYLVLGVIALSTVPILWAWLREPARTPAAPCAVAAVVYPPVARRFFASRNFWLTLAIVSCFWAAVSGLRAHLAALLTDRGHSTALAADTLSVWSVGAFLGHIVMGYALDRARRAQIAALFFTLTLLGFVVMTSTWSTVPALLGGAGLTGLGMGAEVTLAPYLVTRFFGLRSAAEIYAYISLCTGLAGAIGPYLMGLSFDVLHSYGPGLLAAGIALMACVVMALFFGPYQYAVGERS